MTRKDIFEQRMQALHAKYCQQLPDKYQEIERNWQLYLADLKKPDFIEEFYRLVHMLKGTAATFGFTTQADVCFKIQKVLLENKEDHISLAKNNILKIQGYLRELKDNINAPAQKIPE